MGTRSEIRFIKNKKLNKCVYHHFDGYPSHIIDDLTAIEGRNMEKNMVGLSKAHGTVDPKCAEGDKSEKHQGDIEYAYRLYYKKDRKKGGWSPSPEVEKVDVFECDWGEPKKCKKKIFSGSLPKAHQKFVCEGE